MLSKDLGIRQRSMLGVASLLLAASMFGPASTVAGAQAGVQCGMGSGQKATGTPIKLGAIVTKQPGTDFTGITGMAQAYFNCVNDNGGINGRPIRYLVEQEQADPVQDAALARKLIEQDKVLALAGSMSLI